VSAVPQTPALDEPGAESARAASSALAPTAGGHAAWLPYAIAFVLLAAAPFGLEPGMLGTLGRILYYALLAASLDLLIGTVGLPSLAQAAYLAAGAYSAGLVARDVTTSVLVVVPAAVVIAALAAAATGWLAIRSRGIFFLMITLAIGEIFFQVAETAQGVTGGSNGLYGIPAFEVGGTALGGAASKYWFVLAGFAAGFAVLSAVSRSPFGLSLRGIREDEDRMRAIGYATTRYKYAAYCIAGAVAGLAGALLAGHQQLVTTGDASFGTAVLALVAVVIGGAGSLWGPCVGAAIVVLVRDELGLSLGGHGPLLLGIVFVLAVYLLPEGLAGLPGKVRARRAAR
jgi:branched-chain amino acid transport system permease protein